MTDEELEDQVQAFAEHRAQLKPPSPMTPRAIEQLKKRALRFRAKGVDLYEAFDKAMTSGWLSIYEPKEEKRPAAHAEYVPDTSPTWNRDKGKSAVLCQGHDPAYPDVRN